MDRTTTIGSSLADAGSAPNPASIKVEAAAQVAHQVTDRIADKASAEVGRLSGGAHRAVNSTADAAMSAAEWASTIPEQARQAQTQLTESAIASIRAHPLTTVGSALLIGYLLGRLARL